MVQVPRRYVARECKRKYCRVGPPIFHRGLRWVTLNSKNIQYAYSPRRTGRFVL